MQEILPAEFISIQFLQMVSIKPGRCCSSNKPSIPLLKVGKSSRPFSYTYNSSLIASN
jgi:hypothetical protein